MSKPVVAIVGRPNVGKSTLFNVLAGERISIVQDTPGVTRDRIYADVEWLNHKFTLVDTGGIEPESKDIILSQMRDQAVVAMDMADLILFMVDGKEGLTTADIEVGAILRRTGKKVILAVNKIDNPSKMPDTIYDFYELGLGEPIPISSANMLNIGDLLDEIVSGFPDKDYEADEENIKLAIIGKPNVGKSSLVNALTKENRVIVSPIAGTTRDSIDTPFSFEGNDFTLIDTAGLRRRSKVYDSIEKFSVIRAIAAGKVAAANIDEYLGYHHVIDVGVEVPTARLNNKPPHGRITTTEREADERKRDFKCIECGLTDEEAYAEASRCLRCDHFGYGIFRGGRKGKW